MSSIGIDVAKELVTLLDDNWTIANTDSKKPTIKTNLEKAWEDIPYGAGDFLYVKANVENINTGLYAADFFHKVLCSIEVISGENVLGTPERGRLHFEKIIEEVARIIKANPRRSGYADSKIRSVSQPRYDKSKGIFITSIDAEFMKVRTS